MCIHSTLLKLVCVLDPVGRTQNTVLKTLGALFQPWHTPKMIVPLRKGWAPNAFTVTFKVHNAANWCVKTQFHITWFEKQT